MMITTTTLHCQHLTTPALHMQTVPLLAKYATNLLWFLLGLGSTESFEDRRCIATGEDVEFSTEDTASCCRSFACGFSMGCNGGQPSAALQWMASTGVVTGGDYPDIGSAVPAPYTLNHVHTTYLQQRNTQMPIKRVPNSSMHSILPNPSTQKVT